MAVASPMTPAAFQHVDEHRPTDTWADTPNRPPPRPRILRGKAQALAEPLPCCMPPRSVSVLFNNFRIKPHFSAESGWLGRGLQSPPRSGNGH